MAKCAQKVLDRADIVRDVRYALIRSWGPLFGGNFFLVVLQPALLRSASGELLPS